MSRAVGISRGELEHSLARLFGPGFQAVELYGKEGWSCRWRWSAEEGASFLRTSERGFAARAGSGNRSGFWVRAGSPPDHLDRSVLRPGRLRLPRPLPARRSPLAEASRACFRFEEEAGSSWFATLRQGLKRAAPELEPSRAELEVGCSGFRLVSTTGLHAEGSMGARRVALELRASEQTVSLELPFLGAAEVDPEVLVEPIVERWQAIRGTSRRGLRLRGPLVATAPVMARLLEGLAQAERWFDFDSTGARRRSPVSGTSPFWTVVHDGGDPRGPLATLWDGEGTPTGRYLLLNQGQWVGGWLDDGHGEGPALGCFRRDSYRDPPRMGFLQLFLEPVPDTSARELETELDDGAVLVAAQGQVQQLPGGRFTLKVSGFQVRGGQRREGLGLALLEGSFAELRRGLRRLASDLTWVPGDGVFGAPSARLEGLELLF